MDDSLHLFDNKLLRELFVSVRQRFHPFSNSKLWVFKKVYNTVKLGKQIDSSMLFSPTFKSMGSFHCAEQEIRNEAL